MFELTNAPHRCFSRLIGQWVGILRHRIVYAEMPDNYPLIYTHRYYVQQRSENFWWALRC